MKKRSVYKKSVLVRIGSFVLPAVLTLAVALMVFYGLNETEESSRTEGLRLLEESLRRATVKCYAVEGSYPESLSYIVENYGVRIDRTKYFVDYQIFASNILPSITVVELK